MKFAKKRNDELGEKHKVTKDLIDALEQLQASASRPTSTEDLACEGYAKLQFDFPIVGAAEVNALADLFQHCLELKMGGGLGPLSKYLVTAKFVDNIVHGAKQPPPLLAPTSEAPHIRAAPSSYFPSPPLPSSPLASSNAEAAPGPSLSIADTAAGDAAAGGASATALLQAAYQRLCTCVLLRYTAVALRVPEWDAWHMLATYQVSKADAAEVGDGEGGGFSKDGGVSPSDPDVGGGAANKVEQGGSLQQSQQLSPNCEVTGSSGGNAGRVMDDGVEAAEPDPDDLEFEPLEEPSCVPLIPNGSQQYLHHTTHAHTSHTSWSAPFPQNSVAMHPLTPCTTATAGAAAAGELPGRQGSWGELLHKLHALVSSDHLDALLPTAGTGEATAKSSTTTTASTIHPTATPANTASSNSVLSNGSSISNWKANSVTCHGRDDARNSDHTAAATATAAPDLDAWRLSDTGGALMELLRSIGVHAHATDLHPLLQACVGLLGRRLVAHPEEMAMGLQQLWDTLGVCGVASMPPALQGYSTGSTAAGDQHQPKRLVLAPEANVALTLLADLAGCHISSQGRTALWRQINLHTLPVLRRCLEDVAAARNVSPDTLAAITLIAKVILFYLEHAPGGLNAPSALLSAGVVRGLAVALPRFGPIPDAHELRAAVLLCASGSPEVCSWVAAVPGVSSTFSGPAFQLGGWGEAHGALWQLLTAAQQQPAGAAASSGKQTSALASPGGAAGSQQGPGQRQERGPLLMVALLEAGMGCSSLSQLQRMHAALELLLMAWQQSRRRRLWGPVVDAALRTALHTLKQALAAPAGGAPLLRASQVAIGAQRVDEGHGHGAQHVNGNQGHQLPGHEASDKTLQEEESIKTGTLRQEHEGLHAANNGQPVIGQDRNAWAAGPGAAITSGVGVGEMMLGVGKGEGEARACDQEGDDKARGLDVGSLEARSVQRMGGACVKQLKELLMTESKMD